MRRRTDDASGDLAEVNRSISTPTTRRTSTVRARYSAVERLRQGLHGSARELAAAGAVGGDALAGAPRTRRFTAQADGRWLIYAAPSATACVTAARPLTLARRRRKIKPRPLVVLCDVSGSMERYSRVLLQFLYVVANRLARVEAFAFSTRLSRLTRSDRSGTVDAALDRAVLAVHDWGSGTRIGAALRTPSTMDGRRARALAATPSCSSSATAGTAAMSPVLAQEMAGCDGGRTVLAQPAVRRSGIRAARAACGGAALCRRVAARSYTIWPAWSNSPSSAAVVMMGFGSVER